MANQYTLVNNITNLPENEIIEYGNRAIYVFEEYKEDPIIKVLRNIFKYFFL